MNDHWSITCECGTEIRTNRDKVDCLSCDRTHHRPVKGIMKVRPDGSVALGIVTATPLPPGRYRVAVEVIEEPESSPE